MKYWEANTASDAAEMTVEDMMIDVEEYLKPLLDFLESSSTSVIKAEFRVPFGSGGPPEYYYRLCRIIKSKYGDFQPEGMEEWEEEQSEERIREADNKLKEIVTEMRRHIFDVLRTIHGEKYYWDRGVSDNTVKTEAYKRSLEYDPDERLPYETYLEILEMKKVVENRRSWQIFKPVFNIPEPGEKGSSKNLKWMERINELRRIPGHPAKERHYKVDDFQYIDFIHEELMGRIKEAQANPILEADGVLVEDDA